MGWEKEPAEPVDDLITVGFLICASLRYFNAAGAAARNGEAHQPEMRFMPLVLHAAEQGPRSSSMARNTPPRTARACASTA